MVMSIVKPRITSSPPTLADDDHEQIVVRQDSETGLRLIVAVHSTVLGPSLGGMRLKRYPGGLREGLADVMALARTMTLKASAAGLPLGGGKAVMIDDGRRELHERRLVKAAEVIEGLGGAYITAEDIGTSTADMDLMARHTRFAVGRSVEGGGGGDPSPITAETVFQAIGRGLDSASGSSELEGRRIGVIGLGKVGYVLAVKLARAGAEVIACDLDATRAERLAAEHGAQVAPSAQAIMGMELDVLAPCAAGGMIDDALARSIDCKVVAGAANNPLTSRAVARTLMDRGILYVPDFLANCGGLIHVSTEWHGERGPDAGHCVARAMERLEQAIATAEAEGRTPIEVAERQALERVEAVRAGGLAAA
jgi:glutamate dehydrogenase/leucine dehydrogenase